MSTEILPKPGGQIVELTSDLVAAYVSNNPVPAADLPGLIADIYASFTKWGAPVAAAAEPLTPPVPIKIAVTRDYIIGVEDAKQYRTLKRHLGLMGLPAQYHAKWLLPADCPMVATAYSARRSELAKQLGLGRTPGTVVPKAAKRAQQK
ncbi:MucR family transcriptional regulator [Aminobacter aminovorans]|jgi:predicted transcriptional regulator|uniref:Transcriptional regulator n=1 Tax=Aminobacter aminovorans TaxID=83263 RepID=A0AAC8YVI8_AMIAI|nr:MucR family transcriptional regulator [Aminobacter aminovorans]AMS45243.1 Transcriptional regulator, MucR family [Aminobacter aminovorans]MBB3704993.1 putative transcriptional regulator [Aminobacter aminovorans]